jgi:hypothetical protein
VLTLCGTPESAIFTSSAKAWSGIYAGFATNGRSWRNHNFQPGVLV